MPNNFQIAKRRLENQRKTIINVEDHINKYIEKIKQLKDSNYIEKVETDDYDQTGNVWYLPHFTTAQAKFCVVNDGAEQFHGTSINDNILSGPDLLTSLFNVLSCFHLGEYAITADLRECFFQVEISEEQRHFFRLLWFKNHDIKTEQIETWCFRVHVWCVVSSLFMATYAIRKVVKENRTNASKTTSHSSPKKYVC